MEQYVDHFSADTTDSFFGPHHVVQHTLTQHSNAVLPRHSKIQTIIDCFIPLDNVEVISLREGG